MIGKRFFKPPAHLILLRAMCFFWLAAKLGGWKVWLSYRLFPVVPPFESIHAPAVIHLILFAASIIFLAVIIIVPYQKNLFLLLFIVELCSCLLDQNRWQPWEYQYMFTLFIFIVYKTNTQKIFASIACILVAIYFYSALNKFNPGFLVQIWDGMILKRFLKITPENIYNPFIYYAGYLLPLIELSSSIGLLFRTTKKLAAYTLIIMHVLNLVILGPFGLNYNRIVWPWNMAMIVFLWIIFLKHDINIKFVWKGKGKIVAFCWVFLPPLQFAGLWDSYLSCNLYSGNLSSMIICVNNNIDSLPTSIFFNKQGSKKFCNEGYVLNVQTWALGEMNVPPYPEERVYNSIRKKWLNMHPTMNSEFYIRHKLNFLSKNPLTGVEEYKRMQ